MATYSTTKNMNINLISNAIISIFSNPTMSPDFELFVATLYGKLPKSFLKYIHHMLQATIKDVKVTNAKNSTHSTR